MRTIAASVALAGCVVLLAPSGALADGPTATSMRIAVPPSAELGAVAQVQARLIDAAGKPVADAVVVFTAPLRFLEAERDVALADARTDGSGIAAAEVDLRSEGPLALTAVYAGDATHAPSFATATIEVQGTSQLYAQAAGVRLPGINTAPTGPGASAGLVEGLSSLWPRLSGWPIALVLMIVWSLYASVVVALFRIASTSRGRAT